MEKLVFVFVFMTGTIFTSCGHSVKTDKASTDSVQVDTDSVDSVVVDTTICVN